LLDGHKEEDNGNNKNTNRDIAEFRYGQHENHVKRNIGQTHTSRNTILEFVSLVLGDE
jgi:hypothetical protein